MKKIFVACVLLVIALSACRLFTPPNEFPSPPPTVLTVKPPIEVTKAPNPPSTPVSGGGYPEVVFKAREALASQLGISVEQITVINVEPVEWPDSCLGVSKPGIMCAMMITPGYRVILRANNSDYEYHTNERSSIVLASIRPSINP
jgi:hypothetical protein